MRKSTVEKYIFDNTGIEVELVKGRGYFYFWSINDIVLSQLVLKYSTSVYVYSVNQLTLDQWLAEFKNIWES